MPCLYNALPATSGVPSSRPGRPGPNVGLVPVVNGIVGHVRALILVVIVVVTSLRGPIEKTCLGYHIVTGVVLGTAVGSAVTILVVDAALLSRVTATGVTVGASIRSVRGSKPKPGHDDLSDAAGAYGAGGPIGITSAGPPGEGIGSSVGGDRC